LVELVERKAAEIEAAEAESGTESLDIPLRPAAAAS
jgi:hypothetical protein